MNLSAGRELVVYRALLLLFQGILLSQVGCGWLYLDGIEADTVQRGDVVRPMGPEFDNLDLEEAFEQMSLTCANSIDCLEGVGLILSRSEEGVYRSCTGFVVAPNLVATNSHCIAPDLGKGDSCRGRLGIAFPNQYGSPYWGLGNQVLECERLVFKTVLNDLRDQDIALFEVSSRYSGHPLKVSSVGIENDLPVKFYAAQVDTDSDPRSVRMERRDCVTKMGSYLNGSYVSAFSPTVAIFKNTSRGDGDCRVLPGNSGSPLLNENNEVVGIVQATLNAASFKDDLSQSYVRNAGIASNLACLYLPETPLIQPSEACNGLNDQNLFQSSHREYLHNLAYGVDSWADHPGLSSLPELREKGLEFEIIPEPSDQERMDRSVTNPTFEENFVQRLGKTYLVQARVKLRCVRREKVENLDHIGYRIPSIVFVERKIVVGEFLTYQVEDYFLPSPRYGLIPSNLVRKVNGGSAGAWREILSDKSVSFCD